MMWTHEQWERHLAAMVVSGRPVHVELHTSPPDVCEASEGTCARCSGECEVEWGQVAPRSMPAVVGSLGFMQAAIRGAVEAEEQAARERVVDEERLRLNAVDVRTPEEVEQAIRELMPCTCGEPTTAGSVHYRDRPCRQVELLGSNVLDAANEATLRRARERTDAFLTSHPRTRDELVREFEQWEHVGVREPSCALCRGGKPEVTVLEQGGDNGAAHVICTDCALDRPTVLLPALRPVGEYDVPPCEQCGHDLLTAAHLAMCRPERLEEIGAELEGELPRGVDVSDLPTEVEDGEAEAICHECGRSVTYNDAAWILPCGEGEAGFPVCGGGCPS